ncbi:hypothetical protein [Mycobacteroides abscessus]|uniref:hypothetical protein n=1 Tax=Mycobacteroides abscessus TaxID=36809 RepID=UPI000C25983F|nr:hypothetical protein [Mycobacteroides abscessus]
MERDLLRHPLEAAGVGFCYDVDRTLFCRSGLEDGPLVIALDSNLVIYLQKHGAAMLDDKPFVGIDPKLEAELIAFAQIIETWLVRDIRFLVLPHMYHDERRPPSDPTISIRRKRSLRLIESALSFQTENWLADDPYLKLARADSSLSLPNGINRSDFCQTFGAVGDRTLILQAMAVQADVLLTCDRKFIRRGGALPTSVTKILSPTALLQRMRAFGMDNFFLGGLIDHAGCIYAAADPLLLGDTTKWDPLLSAIAGDDRRH